MTRINCILFSRAAKVLEFANEATSIDWKLTLFFQRAAKILEFTSKNNSNYLYFFSSAAKILEFTSRTNSISAFCSGAQRKIWNLLKSNFY
jgi:hypothetical protein